MQFDPKQDTLTREYRAVARAHGCSRLFIPSDVQKAEDPETGSSVCTRESATCAEHDGMELQDAFVAVCVAHEQQGLSKCIRKVTGNSRRFVCDCVSYVEFDANIPSEERVEYIGDPIRKCEYHQIADAGEHYAAIREEGERMYKLLSAVEQSLPDDCFNLSEDFHGVQTRQGLIWQPLTNFDDNRVLHCTLHRTHLPFLSDIQQKLNGVQGIIFD